MSRQHGNLAALSLALATVLTTSASAADSGFYLGANIGQSQVDTDEMGILHAMPGTVGVETSTTVWSLDVGYRFSRHLGAEASYLDMGELSGSGFGHVPAGAPNAAAEYFLTPSVSVKGPALSVIGTIPTGNFEFNAKFGALFASTDVVIQGDGYFIVPPNPPLAYHPKFSRSAKTTEVMYGLGAGYTFHEHFQVRVDWTAVPDVGDESETGEGNVQLFTAGFRYRF